MLYQNQSLEIAINSEDYHIIILVVTEVRVCIYKKKIICEIILPESLHRRSDANVCRWFI